MEMIHIFVIKMVLKFICGLAGTGKSHALLELCEGDFVCLALTHAAVKNIQSKHLEKHRFMTLHKFFRIGVNKDGTSKVVYHQKLNLPDRVLIDEFSLINFDILTMIFSVERNNPHVIFLLCGDICQLNPIQNVSPVDIKLFKDCCVQASVIDCLKMCEHLSNNIFATKEYQRSDKMILTKRLRIHHDKTN